jgi:DNA invertase Pin-like site-specific DNA recombinase
MKLKAAAYIRVSTLAQKEGESLSIQRSEIERRAEYEGWELVKVYDEGAGWSGGNGNRPEMSRCMADAMAGKHSVIITLDMMRGFRDLRDCLNALHQLDKHKVKLITIKDKLDSSDPMQRAILLPIMGMLAQWEKDKIKERMDGAKNYLLHHPDGPKIFKGTPPFAYHWNKEAHRLELDPEKAKLYKRIVDMYLIEGLSIVAIVRRLKDEGVVNVKKPFRSPSISRMLKEEVYHTGVYVANKYVYKKDEKHCKKTSEKKPDPVPYETEPIIDTATWDAIQAKLDGSRTRTRWA